MKKLFDGNESDSDVDIKTDNDYAKHYDQWRQKEELNKLKTVYGDNVLADDTDSSSSEDEDAKELTEEVEKDFFKTLACLKNKDPRIYDNNINFFNKNYVDCSNKNKTKTEKPLTLRDHERNLILKGDVDGDEEERPESPTIVEEQRKIRESLLNIVHNDEDDDVGEFGGIFHKRRKTEQDKEKEEEEYRQWLAGQKEELADKNQESELKPLKDYWSNPKLDENESFLRDYLLNKRFLDDEDASYIPSYEEIVHDSDENLSEDERNIEQQEQFEHKYNFRFEEPDQEFLKRYPRTMEHSVRKTDDRRKQKRAEVKERKAEERARKDEELKQLKALKRKEIEAKIQQLREITGNQDIGFQDEDIDGDFDPEAHDARMQQLFDNDYYAVDEGDQKPVFPEDDELMGDDWDNWKGEEENYEENIPHCEDDDFNMDCDYDPVSKTNIRAETQSMLIENSGPKKKRRRKSKFAEMLSKKKPVFDPNDKTYEEYLDEYYKLDYEDIIGDQPCRFKYRKVMPNSFGLTVDEILAAKDKELNSWCSLKKAVQIRPDHVEKYDQIAYERKSKNEDLKRRTLKSLYEEPEETETNEEQSSEQPITNKKHERNSGNQDTNIITPDDSNKDSMEVGILSKTEKKKLKKLKKQSTIVKDCDTIDSAINDVSPLNDREKVVTKISELQGEGEIVEVPKLKKNKKKKGKSSKNDNLNDSQDLAAKSDLQNKVSAKHNKSNKKIKQHILGINKDSKNIIKKSNSSQKKQDLELSESRLRAYGINPKKFKNKQRFKK